MTAAQNLPVAVKAPLKAGGGGVQSIVPQDAEQAFRMAQMIFNSGFAPKDMATPEKIVTAIIAGMEIGLKPFQSVQSFAVVNGRPTIWGDAALGLVQASGFLEDFEETIEGEGDAMVATARAVRSDRKSPIVRTFSAADAKKAGLWGKSGPWTQYPKRMLQLRARAFCLRDGFPDVLRGMRIQEEAADYSGPSTEAVTTHAEPVNAAALIAQAQNVPAPDVGTPQVNDDQAGAAAYDLPAFPEEGGDRNGWLSQMKHEIANADAETVTAISAAVDGADLPDIARTEVNKAIRRRSGELSKAA